MDEYGGNTQETFQEFAEPWEDTELNKSQYLALEVVSDADGHYTSSDLNGEYLNRNGLKASESSTPKVAGRLSELYNMGYVNRPPEQPYYYWVTDEGKALLND